MVHTHRTNHNADALVEALDAGTVQLERNGPIQKSARGIWMRYDYEAGGERGFLSSRRNADRAVDFDSLHEGRPVHEKRSWSPAQALAAGAAVCRLQRIPRQHGSSCCNIGG